MMTDATFVGLSHTIYATRGREVVTWTPFAIDESMKASWRNDTRSRGNHGAIRIGEHALAA